MIIVRRGSTAEITCHIPEDISLFDISDAWLYFTQNIDGCNNEVIIDRSYKDGGIEFDEIEHIMFVQLTQEETLNLKVGTAVLQVRLLFSDGASFPSQEEGVRVLDVYKGGVMS